MKKLVLIAIMLLILPLTFAVQQQSKEIDEGINLKEAAVLLNESKPEIPPPFSNFIKSERVNVYVDNDILSVVVEEGVVVESSNIELPNPTIEARTSWETINKIRNNELKISEALKTKAIDIKGVGFWKGLKVGFFKIGLRMLAPKIDDYLEQEANETQETLKEQKGKKEEAKGRKIECSMINSALDDCSEGTCPKGEKCVEDTENPFNCTCVKEEIPEKYTCEELSPPYCYNGTCPEGKECINVSEKCECKKKETTEYTCSEKIPPNCHLGTCPEGYSCHYATNESTGINDTCSCQTTSRWAQASCTDSDGKDPDKEGYVEGWTKDSAGKKTIYKIWDKCTGSGLQVNEKWCYDNPEGTGKIHGTMVYDCDNGCSDGACK